MDGYTATREILKIKPQIPIVAQTAYAMSGQAQKCKEAGCVDYLAKPIRTEQLVNVLQKYIG
jgi:CheY-like chemotaxis protein